MKALLALMLTFVGPMAIAQTAMEIHDEGLPSQAVRDVKVTVSRVDVCAKSPAQCFELSVSLNQSDLPAMICEAFVGDEQSGSGYKTPVFENRSFDSDRIYEKFVGNYDRRLNFASFIESADGRSSGIAVYDDPENADATRGGIDVSSSCAKQLQRWIKSALLTEGTATITTLGTQSL